jgi:hypothetical protein
MKLGENVKIESEPHCLECGVLLDGACVVNNETRKPEPGDVSVCIRCGHLAVFGDDMQLRQLNDAEIREWAGDPVILAIQLARARIKP